MGFFVTFKKLLYTIEATGWQARGRSNVDFENRCKLDRFYDEHKGLWFDFKILIWTVVSVFQSKGAK